MRGRAVSARLTPAMRTALDEITGYGQDGAWRRQWNGATVAALLRAGAIEEHPTDAGFVRVPAPADHVHAPQAVHHNANGLAWSTCACGETLHERGGEWLTRADLARPAHESGEAAAPVEIPTTGRTLRSVRVPDHIWSAAAERAERDGVSVSAVIVAALREYGRGA